MEASVPRDIMEKYLELKKSIIKKDAIELRKNIENYQTQTVSWIK